MDAGFIEKDFGWIEGWWDMPSSEGWGEYAYCKPDLLGRLHGVICNERKLDKMTAMYGGFGCRPGWYSAAYWFNGNQWRGEEHSG